MPRKKKLERRPVYELLLNYGRTLRVIFSVGRWTAIGYVIATVIGAAFPVVRSWTQGLLINSLTHLAGAGYAAVSRNDWFIFIGFIAASVIPQMTRVVENYFFWEVWYATSEWSELSLIRKKAELDVSMQEDKKVSDLHNRVTENGQRFPQFADRIFDVIHQASMLILTVGVLIFAQWKLFLIILVATIPELVVEVRFGSRVWGIHNAKGEVRRRYFDYRSLFTRLSTLIELKLFQNIPYFYNKIRELYIDFKKEQQKAQRKKLLNQMFVFTFSQAAIVFAIVVFFRQVVEGTLLIGTFVFYLSTIAQFRTSLSDVFRMMGQQYGDSLFISDIFEFLELKSNIVSPTPGMTVPAETPDIVFENVTFTYPGASKPVLKNFSLHIPAGQRVALVGVNGAGKTTFVKILCRFYDPDHGRILINGHDLKKIDLESWYRLIGALFQDYANYHLLVRDAIAVGRTSEKQSVERVMEAAQAAEADTFIQGWERSYKQMLGKNYTGGVEPSVGQWQKLGLARMFYRDPHVLILDEPTSSIDAEAEAKIFEQIDALHHDRTVILISHRFSTVRTADKIYVIRAGRIAEYGSHEELLSAGKTYARLFRLQAKGYT